MTTKEYTFIYAPKIYYQYGNVVYVESKRNERINKFLYDNYSKIRTAFANEGLVFHFISGEILEPVYKLKEEGTERYSEPNSDDEYEDQHIEELAYEANSELLRYLDEPYEDCAIAPSLFFSDRMNKGGKPKEVALKSVSFNEEKDLDEQLKEMIDVISSFFPDNLLDMRPYLYLDSDRICMSPQMATDLEELYLRFRGEGYSDNQVEKLLKQIIRRHRKNSHIRIEKDYRIIFEEFGNKEIKLKDLPKALYLFYLKHNEGIESKDLVEYMPEIAYIYLKISTGKKRDPLNIIENLVVGGQLPNNLKAIRNAFQRNYDLERHNVYSIEPDKKNQNLFIINIPEELREWHCPQIKNKQIPKLPYPEHRNTLIEQTWDILHQLDDSKINSMIGERPTEKK